MDDRTKRLVKRLADHDGDVMHLTRTERRELLSLLPSEVIAEATMEPLPTRLGSRALLKVKSHAGNVVNVDAVLMTDPNVASSPQWYAVQGADWHERHDIVGWEPVS